MFGVPYHSLIRLSSLADGFTSPLFGRAKDPDVATLYSAASIRSIPIPMRQLTLKGQAESFRPISIVQPPPGLNSMLQRSIASIEGNTYGSPITTGQQVPKSAQPADEAEDSARMAYESREIASEAFPVRERPDHVLHGMQGIVRSVVLNDRWHALTVDTMGHVGVWDIVRGQCVGMFEKSDVEKASESQNTPDGQKWKWNPREALEIVRERIEGEAFVNAWCTVDSSIGNLVVHVENNRAFDAEIFADEAGYNEDIKFEEDHRCEIPTPFCSRSSYANYFEVNIGKWVIGNLFAAFVIRQQAVQEEPGYFEDMLASGPVRSPPGLARTGISRQGGPRHINLDARRIRSIAEIAASQRTPGTAASAAIASMTPAVLPELPVDAMQKIASASRRPVDSGATMSQEQSVQHGAGKGEGHEPGGTIKSPPVVSPAPKVPQQSQTADESTAGHTDYFFQRRSGGGEESAATAAAADGTNGAAPPHDETPNPGSGLASGASPAPQIVPSTPVVVSSPGVSPLGFMGKLKALGKTKKAGNASETTESSETTAVASHVDADAVGCLVIPEMNTDLVLLPSPRPSPES